MFLFKSCLPASLALLMSLAIATVPQAAEATQQIAATRTRPTSVVCDGKPTGIYPDPDSCNYYVICTFTKAYKQKCPDELYFNPKITDCDFPKNVNCNPDTRNKCQRIVCYLGEGSHHRNGAGKFTIEDIDAMLCTHIIYDHAKLKGNRLEAKEKGEESTESKEGRYERLIKHKKSNPQLKVLLAVGGWGMGTRTFSRMASSARNRKEFADSSIKFLRARGFDGLQIDWFYPTIRGSPSQDKYRFALLCQELKAAFKKEAKATGKSRLLLTIAVGSEKYYIDNFYDVRRLNEAVDFMNVLINFHNVYDTVAAHHSALYRGSWETGINAYANVRSAVDLWLKYGASKDKLVIGIPFFARSYTLKSESNTKVGAPVYYTSNLKGKYTRKNVYISYYETCIARKKGGKRHFIEQQRVPYLVHGKQWYAYEEQGSVKEKSGFVIQRGLGGVMVASISLDDFKGLFCGQGKFPLVNAIHRECHK